MHYVTALCKCIHKNIYCILSSLLALECFSLLEFVLFLWCWSINETIGIINMQLKTLWLVRYVESQKRDKSFTRFRPEVVQPCNKPEPGHLFPFFFSLFVAKSALSYYDPVPGPRLWDDYVCLYDAAIKARNIDPLHDFLLSSSAPRSLRK